MDDKIKKILIVGGGTAGWLSALFFDKIINTEPEKFCEITLVESKTVGIIGVGESTLNTLITFLKPLDIDEYELMVNCDASFKLGIKFINWFNGNNEAYYNPFSTAPPNMEDFSLFDIWLNKKLNGEKVEDYAYYFPNPRLSDFNKSPKQLNEKRNFVGNTEYAYHLNAELLGKYLARIGTGRGIKHIVDNVGVTDVSFDENGFISSVKTSEHGELSADFFVDCSGFKGILINKAYKEPFISHSDSLLNDYSVAVRLPVDNYPNGMPSYTKSTAMKCGWIWDVPLYSRRGVGYVYCSKFISKEEAERELMEDYLGMKVGDIPANHIKMRVGQTRNLWVKNCLSIGLSTGFIEPLEATGIGLIQIGLSIFHSYFPDKTFNPKLIKTYNDYMTQLYNSTKDFLVMHYCTTKREDTEYWKTAKYGLKISDALKDDFELFEENFLSFYHKRSNNVNFFNSNSYLFVLTGMNKLPPKPISLMGYKSHKNLEELLENIPRKNNSLFRAFPDHYEYLSQLYNNRNME